MMHEESALPSGWELSTIGEVATVNPPLPESAVEDQDLVTFLPMRAVEPMTNRFDASEQRPWRDVKKGYVRFQDGDVLFAKITPCMENGKIVLVKGLTNTTGAGSTEFHVLRARVSVSPLFLTYYVLQEQFRRDAQRRMTGTAGQLRVPSSFMEEASIPVAPLPEQRRIVEAIETQLTRLDAAIAALERVKKALKRYRASVLKAAVEGRLVPTEAELARREGRTYEPASVLLERILKERRRRWEEAELAKMTAAGKLPKDEGWKKKYTEPVAPNTTDLPDLPEGWCWAALSQLSWDASYGSSVKCSYAASGVPVLRIPNVVKGRIALDDVKFAAGPLTLTLANRDELSPGDFLVIRTNGSRNLIGRAAVLVEPLKQVHYFASYLIRLRLVPGFAWRWLLEFWHSSTTRIRLEAEAASSAGQYNVSLKVLARQPIALPPLVEQTRLLAEIDQLNSATQAANDIVEASLNRSHRLRQSILKWAFEGKLVPQDPTDEPASVLLERIKAERQQAQFASTPVRGPNRKRKTA